MSDPLTAHSSETSALVAHAAWLVGQVYGVTFDDLCQYNRKSNVAQARHMFCLMLREESGLSRPEIARIIGRDRQAVKSSIFQAKKAVRGRTARQYLVARMPVEAEEKQSPTWCPKLPHEQIDRIVGDLRMGLSAHETMYYWPFGSSVDLASVKQVRVWARGVSA